MKSRNTLQTRNPLDVTALQDDELEVVAGGAPASGLTAAPRDPMATENLSLNYDKITWKYWPV